MKAGVVDLPLGEPARFNPGQLEKLCDALGELRAEAEVAHALDRLATLLDEVARLGRHGDAGHLEEVLAALVRDAHLIGMATLARVARSVLHCLDAGDPTALAATMARLNRVGDRSIHAIWDLEDLSG
ncbi:hypothetical protein [Roseicyclus mahoneyensis]|uniref:Hpt domain-containing protein n=1 Tax=Roseicyclus mahoneyensis TaxID=164332 RepID=A0A316GFY7_9RHOB|nr:hypothetical protein [Roseicyclus mahoneyensis]PWK59835.1 hypothetical protein C7455_106121 [Roseicyclus mahoneyensis]